MVTMPSYKHLVIINIIFGILLFLSSEFLLFILKDKLVKDIGLFIGYTFTDFPPPPTVTDPLPNYPLLMFIIMIIINLAYLVWFLRRRHQKTQV